MSTKMNAMQNDKRTSLAAESGNLLVVRAHNSTPLSYLADGDNERRQEEDRHGHPGDIGLQPPHFSKVTPALKLPGSHLRAGEDEHLTEQSRQQTWGKAHGKAMTIANFLPITAELYSAKNRPDILNSTERVKCARRPVVVLLPNAAWVTVYLMFGFPNIGLWPILGRK